MNAPNTSQIGSQNKTVFQTKEQNSISKESHAAISEALHIILKNDRITFGDLNRITAITPLDFSPISRLHELNCAAKRIALAVHLLV